jgi:hypothetical protein
MSENPQTPGPITGKDRKNLQDKQRKKLKQIENLIAKADSLDKIAADNGGGINPEAEACRERAMKLMVEYGIDAHMLEIGREDAAKPEARRIWVPTIPFGRERVDLMSGIGLALRVMTIRSLRPEWGKGPSPKTGKPVKQEGYWMTVVGFPVDLDRALMLWTSLIVQCQHATYAEPLPDHITSADDKWGQKKGTWRRNFVMGWNTRVIERIHDLHAEVKAAAEKRTAGTELVLADKQKAVDDLVFELFPNLTKGSIRKSTQGDALTRGYAEGANADVGQKKTGSGSKGEIDS